MQLGTSQKAITLTSTGKVINANTKELILRIPKLVNRTCNYGQKPDLRKEWNVRMWTVQHFGNT
jgi:hypothetical protein